MVTKETLCKIIESVFPKIGKCGRDFDVEYDKDAKAWAVDLHSGEKHLRTFIEDSEADSCVEGRKCMPLTLQIAQLKENFEKYTHEDHALG